MTRRIRLASGGVVAEAELLDDNAPKNAEAFWSMLPMERKLISAKWSGDVAVIHPGPGPLAEIGEYENPVTSIYPGAIVVRPNGSEILFGYGVGEYRWAVGVDYLSRIGKVTKNRREFFDVLARTADHGPSTVTISAVEE